MKSKRLFYFVICMLGAGAVTGYALHSNGNHSSEGAAGPASNPRDALTTLSASTMPSSIEEKAAKADAAVIGTAVKVSGTFSLPDPNEPEGISIPFQDAVIDIDRIVFGGDEISRHSESMDELRVRTLALAADSGTFIEGKRYLIILRSPCTDCIYGPDAFAVVGEDHGRFLLEGGRASNAKEGEMAESELVDRIAGAGQ